jgi:hypothetical protein
MRHVRPPPRAHCLDSMTIAENSILAANNPRLFDANSTNYVAPRPANTRVVLHDHKNHPDKTPELCRTPQNFRNPRQHSRSGPSFSRPPGFLIIFPLHRSWSYLRPNRCALRAFVVQFCLLPLAFCLAYILSASSANSAVNTPETDHSQTQRLIRVSLQSQKHRDFPHRTPS